LNANGTLDTGFNAAAAGFFATVYSMVLQPDGKILVGGFFEVLNGQSRIGIGRLNADGTLDTGFNPQANAEIFSTALQPDGRILVAGRFTLLGGQSRSWLGRLNGDG